MTTDLEQIISGDVPDESTEPTPEPVEAQAEPEPVSEQEPVTQPEPVSEPEPQEDPLQRELGGIKAALVEARSELRELKQAQPKPEARPAPDMFEDPEGYQKHQAMTAQQMQQNLRLDMSEEMARQAHGDDVVDAAFEALKAAGDQATFQSLMAQRSPYNALVDWHKQQKVVLEIGSDPDAWIAAKEAEITARVKAEMVAEQAKAEAAKPAPSMANLTGIGGGPKGNWTGPTPLDEIVGS